MNSFRCVALLLASAMLAVAIPVPAQVAPPPAPAAALPAAPPIAQDLLDSLLAPIALYPDQLLTQVLMASTYPLEVVEAARFVSANPNLRGPALDDALRDKTWDASVLSLAAFPQVLDMMSDKLDWTQRLGDAFLDDEAGVMRTVQTLRWRAQQAGNLESTAQQNVVVQERTIVIEPAQPQYLYVPVYNPAVIYGPWWAPAYRPWFWYPPPVWGYPPYYGGALAAGIFWGSAWAITANNWGWCRPNWGGNNINIYTNNSNYWVNRPQYRDRYQNNGNWNHNVEHRRGVAYRDTATGNRYRPVNNAGVQTRESYRGRDGVTRPAPATLSRPASDAAGDRARPSPGTYDRPVPGSSASTSTRPSPGTSAGSVTRPSPGASAGNDRGRRPSTAGTVAGRRPPRAPRRRDRGRRRPTSPNRGRRCSATPTGARRAARPCSVPHPACNGRRPAHRSARRPATTAAAAPTVVPAADRRGVAHELRTPHHEEHSCIRRRACGTGIAGGHRVDRDRGRPGAVGRHPTCLRAEHLRVAGGGRQGARRCHALRRAKADLARAGPGREQVHPLRRSGSGRQCARRVRRRLRQGGEVRACRRRQGDARSSARTSFRSRIRWC